MKPSSEGYDAVSNIRVAEFFAKSALVAAGQHLGQTAKNPSVGCVLYSESGGGTNLPSLIACNATAQGGTPHAEERALQQAGEQARGATLYVTLEPCAHDRTGGSCAEKIVKAGVRRVIYILEDPDPRTAGKGLKRLREGGVEVEQETNADRIARAKRQLIGHTCRVREKRPAVILKLAVSEDGYIAPLESRSESSEVKPVLNDAKDSGTIWLSDKVALRRAHLLRASCDAILVGSGTVLADNPLLSVRISSWRGTQPLRIVLDGRLRIPATARVAQTEAQKTWIFTAALTGEQEQEKSAKAQALRDTGVRVLETPRDETALDISFVLKALYEAGISRLFVEGGAKVAQTFLNRNLVDEVAWFQSPRTFEGGGLASPLKQQTLQDSNHWHCYAREKFPRTDGGTDGLTLYTATRNL